MQIRQKLRPFLILVRIQRKRRKHFIHLLQELFSALWVFQDCRDLFIIGLTLKGRALKRSLDLHRETVIEPYDLPCHLFPFIRGNGGEVLCRHELIVLDEIVDPLGNLWPFHLYLGSIAPSQAYSF